MGSRKIKRRTRGRERTVKMTPDVVDVVQRQIDKFRAKFGREPGKDDPLFFDEGSFLPRPMDSDAVSTHEQVEARKGERDGRS
jgi:hypothetical protein